MEDDSDMFLTGLKDWKWHNLSPLNLDSSQTHKTHSKQWSVVVIKDSSSTPTTDAGDDFSVFPPSNHENLTPSHFNSESKHQSPPSPSSPVSPFSFLPSDFDPSPQPPPAVSLLPKWWGFAVQILRSRIANIGSYFGCNNGDKRSFWSFGNVALAVTVVLWWLCMRVRRKWQRRKSVGHLMQIISDKDKQIMQLLNQIAQMNELLLTRHKVKASKLAD
ncbi:hypothetical protein JCGZ_11663 [Jatropha curcas]|uniref:Transmembrane protein n=1 Tax=Jatropha curcas TaxID=180498 RepID=A0A067K5A4_JATCU|nr:hypothetical protein JCGZ_11663 [Jatropha curcas]